MASTYLTTPLSNNYGYIIHQSPTIVLETGKTNLFTLTRDSSSSKNVKVSFTINTRAPFSGNYKDHPYSQDMTVVIYKDVTTKFRNIGGTNFTVLNSGTVAKAQDYSIFPARSSLPYTNPEVSVTDVEFECDSNSSNIAIVIFCSQDGYHSCGSGSGDFSELVIGMINTNDITHYDPYTPPSITLNDRKEKGTFGVNNDFWVKYNVYKGTRDIQRVVLSILDSNDNALQEYGNLSTSTNGQQEYYYTVTDSHLSNGGSYRIRLRVQDGQETKEASNKPNIYIYVPPSLSWNGNKDLGVYNKNNDYWVQYTINGGSDSIIYAGLEILDSSGINVLKTYTNISKTTGSMQTYTYTLNGSNLGNGSAYKIRLYVQDGTSTIYSSLGNIHTCHYPSVSNLNLYSGSTVITSFSPQNTSVQFKWTQDNNNNNLWTGEAAQTNMLYTETGSSQHALYPGNNDTSLTLTQANANVLFPVSERNASSVSKNVTLSRYHSQIPVRVTSPKNVTLQLQPTKTPNGFKIYDVSGVADITSRVQNQRISKTTYQQVVLKWTYPSTEIASGVVDGYKIELYEDQNCTTLIKNLGLTAHSDYSNERYTLNVKQDCKSLVLNYVKITPYYKYDNNNRYYGTNALIQPLFIPYGELSTPVISYPINNTTWHNEKFRVLFQLPADDDYDSSQSSTYRYRDIEINIEYIVNSTTSTKTYTYINNPTIFSTSTLSYQKKIVINPSLLNTLPVADKYKIKIKVGKIVSNETIWSPYSSIVTLNRQDLAPLESGGEDYQTIYEELNEILNESDSYTNPGDTNINIYNELNTILDESDPYTGSGTGTIVVGRNNKSITL